MAVKIDKKSNKVSGKPSVEDIGVTASVLADVAADLEGSENARPSVHVEEATSRPNVSASVPATLGVSVRPDDRNEIVRVIVLEEVSPAPRIGNYRIGEEKNIVSLTKGYYEFPRYVAEVLVDAKKAEFIR
jgi:hypothetical protein